MVEPTAQRASRREIRVLSPGVVNKIAAGEVIERPASVVKELMENAVDAGSKRIDVSVEKGGTELIRIVDDGCGIAQDQLGLAITSHATSKIESADDLFEVGTLGFRGEALASIAEISHFTLRSRVAEADSAFELEVNGGSPAPVRPIGAPVGTTIEVRNLFFNTPVRRRYLRTAQTESGHIGEAFTRIALAYPDRHFRLAHNGRTVHDLPEVDNWKERIGHFFGNDIRQSLIAVGSEDQGVRISGYIVDPAHSRAHNRMQYLFLNGRAIRDRALQHALGEAYRGLLMTGRFPIAFLRLEMPPDMVDVNVHPCKLEVRLQEGGRLYSQLLSAIRTQFLSTDLTAHVGKSSAEKADGPKGSDTSSEASRPEWPANASSQSTSREQINRWAEGQLSRPRSTSHGASPGRTQASETRESQLTMPLRATATDQSARSPWSVGDSTDTDGLRIDSGAPLPTTAGPGTHSSSTVMPQADGVGEPDQTSNPEMLPAHDLEKIPRVAAVQIQNRYLVCEDERGMVIIDQHALHERILYEELREKIQQGDLETQRMLVPEPVSLSPAETAAVLERRDLLRQIGIEVEPFGGETVLITSYPAMLTRRPPAEILRNLVEELMVEGKTPEKRDVLDDLLALMACKAAVKAGDRLSGAEIDALLEHQILCQDSHHCPHGRPTALVFSREELDRRFKRI